VGFVIFFTTFLIGCIDYKRIPAEGNGRLSDVMIDRCVSKCASSHRLFALELTPCRFSGFTLVFFTFFGAFYAWQIISFLLGIPQLMGMYQFYTHLLNIPNVSA
jgi:autophagy-related protein 9